MGGREREESKSFNIGSKGKERKKGYTGKLWQGIEEGREGVLQEDKR